MMKIVNNKLVTIIIITSSLIITGLDWSISQQPLLALPLGLSVLLMLFVLHPCLKTESLPVELAQSDTLVINQPAPIATDIPEIKAIRSIDSKVSDLALLQRVASLEKNSDHPFALAIQQAAKAKRFELLEVSNFKSFAGLGVTGFVSDRKMVVGNATLLRQEGINPGPLEALARNLLREGFTVALVAAEGRPIGLISAQARLKPEDNLMLADLQIRGFSVVQVPANLPPEQKDDLIKKLTAEGAKVAVATDGLENLLKSIEAARAQSASLGQSFNLNSLYKALTIPGVTLVSALLLRFFLSPLTCSIITVLISILVLSILLYRQRISNATR